MSPAAGATELHHPRKDPLRAPRRSDCRQRPAGVVRVLDHDPDLMRDLDVEAAAAARVYALARGYVLDNGHWTPPRASQCAGAIGLLLLDGLMTRCVTVKGITCPELLGQGDVVRPWEELTAFSDGERTTSWRVLKPVTFAVLGDRFAETIRRWPSIGTALLTRSIDRSRWLGLQMAVPQVRRADDRLRLLMGDLAGRWGKVTPYGVVLPLPLTNQLLAELTCLRRPTVSSTMTRLARTGEIVRRPRAGFVLNLSEEAGRLGEEGSLRAAA